MIQPTDLKRFRELLEMTHRKNGKDFKTDEIRAAEKIIFFIYIYLDLLKIIAQK